MAKPISQCVRRRSGPIEVVQRIIRAVAGRRRDQPRTFCSGPSILCFLQGENCIARSEKRFGAAAGRVVSCFFAVSCRNGLAPGGFRVRSVSLVDREPGAAP